MWSYTSSHRTVVLLLDNEIYFDYHTGSTPWPFRTGNHRWVNFVASRVRMEACLCALADSPWERAGVILVRRLACDNHHTAFHSKNANTWCISSTTRSSSSCQRWTHARALVHSMRTSSLRPSAVEAMAPSGSESSLAVIWGTIQIHKGSRRPSLCLPSNSSSVAYQQCWRCLPQCGEGEALDELKWYIPCMSRYHWSSHDNNIGQVTRMHISLIGSPEIHHDELVHWEQ